MKEKPASGGGRLSIDRDLTRGLFLCGVLLSCLVIILSGCAEKPISGHGSTDTPVSGQDGLIISGEPIDSEGANISEGPIISCNPDNPSCPQDSVYQFSGCPGCSILLITVETTRADHLPCYGYSRDTMPKICGYAKNAALFENAYSQAPVTIPSLRSIMTGKTISNENQSEITAFYEDTVFLAEILREKGYFTAAFTDHRGLGEKAGPSEKIPLRESGVLQKGFLLFKNFGNGSGSVSSPELTLNVLDWIDENKEKKFFLWVHFYDPHHDYIALPEYEDAFGYSSMDCGRYYNGMPIEEIRKIEGELTPDELGCIKAVYDTELFFTDLHIGKVLERLETHGIENRTMVAITADHGEEFLERSRIGHEYTVYNENIHVPLIIFNPYDRQKGRIGQDTANSVLFSIFSSIDSGHQLSKAPLISRSYHYYSTGSRPNEFSLIMDKRKYILTPREERKEYYSLHDDPGELNNLAPDGESQDLLDMLAAWLEENTADSQKPSLEAQRIQDETNERLRSLGYMV